MHTNIKSTGPVHTAGMWLAHVIYGHGMEVMQSFVTTNEKPGHHSTILEPWPNLFLELWLAGRFDHNAENVNIIPKFPALPSHF